MNLSLLNHIPWSVRHAAAAWTSAAAQAAWGEHSRGEFGILMYHRINDIVPGKPRPTWNVPPQVFKRQLRGLLRRGFEAWPLRKCLAYRAEGKMIPSRVFVVTFDDCFESVYRRAFPILRELRVPATCFLATSFLDSPEPFPFDDWTANGDAAVPADAWRPLGIDQCRQMQSSGLIELAAHTHTHQDFRGRPDALRDDVRTCLDFLREMFGLTDATFAFPYGTKKLGFSGPQLAAAVKEAGALCSLTTEWSTARIDGDPFDWGRFTAFPSDNSATLAGKLSGWYAAIRRGTRSLLHSASQTAKVGGKLPAGSIHATIEQPLAQPSR